MGQTPFSLNSPTATSLETAAGVIANVVNQYIVSANNAPPGVSGYVFDVIDDEELHLESEITDSWIETNSPVQDHIVLKPLRFTLKGFVGELTDLLQIEVANAFTSVRELLPIVGILPNWNAQDGQVYTQLINVSNQAQRVVSQVSNVASLVNQLTSSGTRQQQAYNIFYNFWLTRTLCTIQTPFGLLTNMAIESVRPLQSGKSRIFSEFIVTFKQLQFVGTAVTSTIGNPNPAGSATQTSPQQSATNPNGTLFPNAPPPNFPSQIQSGISGSTASGRLADAVFPNPNEPGANNAGVELYPNTKIPVSIDTSFLNNSDYTASLPATLPIPPIRGPVPAIPFGGV